MIHLIVLLHRIAYAILPNEHDYFPRNKIDAWIEAEALQIEASKDLRRARGSIAGINAAMDKMHRSLDLFLGDSYP